MYLKLAWRSFEKDRVRFATAVFGVACAVALVSWHVGLAMTAIHSGAAAARRATSPFSAWLTGPEEGRRGGPSIATSSPSATAEATSGRRMGTRATPIPPPLLKTLQDAPGIVETLLLEVMPVSLDVRPGGRVLQGPPLRGNIALLPKGGIPFDVAHVEGRLPAPDSAEPEVVVWRGLLEPRVPAPDIGECLPMILAGGTAAPRITGYFEMSGIIQIFPAIYANTAAMEAIKAASPHFAEIPNLALFATADGTAGPVERALASAPPRAARCRLYSTDAVAARFRTDSVNNLLSSMPLSLALAVIMASCLVATILLIGLVTRRRRIAELRCAGMTRGGVAKIVFFETAMTVLSGWAFGTCIAGSALKLFLATERGGDLPESPFLGWQTPATGLALSAVVGLFAAAIPAVSAMRVRPLEIASAPDVNPKPASLRRTVLSVLLLLPMILCSVWPGLGDVPKTAIMGLVGLPCFAASLLQALQPSIRTIEALLLRPLAWMLRLDPAILKNRLGREPARVSGTVATLALGLGGFIAIHVWGGTLMSSFVPSPEWPDAIVSILPSGWSDDQVAAAAQCPGVDQGRVIKIDCSQKPFDPDSPAFVGREKDIPRGSVLLFGSDPEASFGGENPFAPFKFVAGNRAEAISAMREGRGCVIVSMLARLAGLKIGDKVRFAGRELEISGIVDLNWHMVTSRSLVRTQFGKEGALADGASPFVRTIGTAFVSEDFVRGITGNDVTYFVWLRMTSALNAQGGLKATVRLDEEIRAAVRPDGASAIQVHHRDEIADGTLSHGNDILGVMARIPFWSLAVASTGMVALLLASIQGSIGEFRVMRAVGMTWGQLARLIFCEALLVAAASMVLGVVFGIAVGWSFTGMSRWMAMAGLPIRLIVPWRIILRGMAFALSMCCLMSAIPLMKLKRLVDSRS